MKKQKILVYDEPGSRLDAWLAKNFPEASRSLLVKLIKSGNVKINHSTVTKASKKVNSGDIIEIIWEGKRFLELEPLPLPLEIVYQDEDILVINKPAGIATHPVNVLEKNTLINALLYHGISLARYGAPLRPGIVHRLDKETSGIMIIAKSDVAYLKLIEEFRKRRVKKVYLAIVEGKWKEKPNELTLPISRNKRNPCLMEVNFQKGKEAQTLIKPYLVRENYSLLLVNPQTGRTHQIRVHLSFVGHPIVGDKRYGTFQSTQQMPRQALHAFSISLKHPTRNQELTFYVDLPGDMKEFLLKHFNKLPTPEEILVAQKVFFHS